jgi:hypothetical protein
MPPQRVLRHRIENAFRDNNIFPEKVIMDSSGFHKFEFLIAIVASK